MSTLMEVGGDFSTLAALFAAGEPVADVSGTWSADDTFSGVLSPPSLDTTITVMGESLPPEGVAHDGVGSWYRLRKTGTGNGIIIGRDFTVTGLDYQAQGATLATMIINNQNKVNLFTDCIFGTDAKQTNGRLFQSTQTGASTITFTNTFFYSISLSVIELQNGDGTTLNARGCTALDCGQSANFAFFVEVDSTYLGTACAVNVFDCLLSNAGLASSEPFRDLAPNVAVDITIAQTFTDAAAWESGSAANLVVDADSQLSTTFTDNPSPGAGAFAILTDVTTSPFNGNLQNNAVDNDAQDAHTDSSGANLTMPALDIRGTIRPRNTRFDIGAFEFPVVSLPPAYGGDGIGTLPPIYGVVASGSLPPAYPPVPS